MVVRFAAVKGRLHGGTGRTRQQCRNAFGEIAGAETDVGRGFCGPPGSVGQAALGLPACPSIVVEVHDVERMSDLVSKHCGHDFWAVSRFDVDRDRSGHRVGVATNSCSRSGVHEVPAGQAGLERVVDESRGRCTNRCWGCRHEAV